MQTKRVYMNEADASPGNGAPAALPVTPAPAAAPTAPTEPPKYITSDQLAEQLAAFKNGFFADARKAGLLGKEKPTEAQPAPTPAAAPASTGLSATDVKVMIERTRALERAAVEHKLTDAQVKRMSAALEVERPDDASAWAKTYLADMGLVRATETNTPTQVTPNSSPATAPISDKGSPAPGGAVAYERELAENPVGMSPAAFAMLVAKHGSAEAWRMRIAASQSQAARIKVTR